MRIAVIATLLSFCLPIFAIDPDERALLATISAQPAEDTPRLIYADWLEEHGQEARAKFIRMQIERARLHPDREEPSIEEFDLLKMHGAAWVPELSKELTLHYGGYPGVFWHRGFPAEITIEWHSLHHRTEHVKGLLENLNAFPVVPKVTLRGVEERPNQGMRHLALLTRVRQLEVRGPGITRVDEILTLIPSVRHLVLDDHHLSTGDFHRLFQNSRELESLTLSDLSTYTEASAISLADVNWMAHLKALTLRGRSELLPIFLRPNSLPALRELDLSEARISLEDLERLAAALKGRPLRSLRLPSRDVVNQTHVASAEEYEKVMQQFAAFTDRLQAACELILKKVSEI